jgi:uncharacterized repeat protein (TIGR03803 family)
MFKKHCLLLSIALVLTLMLAGAACAQGQYKEIFSFPGGANGGSPYPPISDAAGNLYGVTQFGGVSTGDGWGVVYKLSPGSGGSWNETVLYAFTGGADGGSPEAALTIDAAGNLYGTTQAGGLFDCEQYCGVVFEVSPNSNGTWSEKVLHSFTGAPDGFAPVNGVVFDKAGNLYGTTGAGGQNGWGTVFELTPNGDGTWSESTLANFTSTGKVGTHPSSTLFFDKAGNLYGTMASGGDLSCNSPFGCGTVFELSPQAGGAWALNILHIFSGPDGGDPDWLTMDSSGNLLGAAYDQGSSACTATFFPGCGTIFELSPTGEGKWKPSLLHKFKGSPGESAVGVIVDGAGNLYGTTASSGTNVCGSTVCGTVFKMTPLTGGGYSYSTLHQFLGGTDGYEPQGAPIIAPNGNLYGVTFFGGDSSCGAFDGCGTVYQITP